MLENQNTAGVGIYITIRLFKKVELHFPYRKVLKILKIPNAVQTIMYRKSHES